MKLLPFIKKGFNIFIKDLRMLAITFLIFPIAMATVYGGMQKEMFEGKGHTIDPFKVDFQFDENSAKGKALNEILSQESVKKLIIKEADKAEYSVIITDDFKKIEIKGKNEASTQFAILKSFTTAVVNNFNQTNTMQTELKKLSLSDAQVANIISSVMSSISKSRETSSVKETIIEGYKTLSSIEYYTISIFSFTSLMLVVTLSSYFFKEVKEGILKRSLSTPNNKRNYFISFVLNAFLISLIISTIYVVINRIRGIVFTGNILYLGLTILAQSLLCAAVVGVVIAFIKKEVTANIIINTAIISSSMFGGVFFSTDFISSKVLQKVMSSLPNTLILNSYKGMAISGDLQIEVIIMALIAILLLVAAMIKIELKWEVQ